MVIENGDAFYAFNNSVNPSKYKYHFCANQNNYFLINTKPSNYSLLITKEECDILDYDSHIDMTTLFCYPVRNFNVDKQVKLNKATLKKIKEKAEYATLYISPIRIKNIIATLEELIETN